MNRRLYRRCMGWASLLAIALMVGAEILAATAAEATDYAVNTLNDSIGGGACSLRDAISAANGSPDAGSSCTAPGSGADTITFKVTGAIILGETLPEIKDSNLTIAGPSGGLTIDGAGRVRLMIIAGGSTVYLDDLTFANGNPSSGFGGSIVNGGTLTVLNSTFSHNHAPQFGGAISNGGPLTVVNSTFYDNTAIDGGAIDGDNLTIVNSTFYRNGGKYAGTGAISNTARGRATVRNTILVGSAPGSSNCHGAITDGGYNVSDDTSCRFSDNFIKVTSASDVLNTTAGLTDNGGPTKTIADLGPAVDAIPFERACLYRRLDVDPCDNPLVRRSADFGPLKCDQRGKARPDPGDTPATCDVGAFEQQDILSFAKFKVQDADIFLPNKFKLSVDFRLAKGSSGINPVTQDLTLTIGSGAVTVPAGSFSPFFSSYLFIGNVEDVNVHAEIKPLGEDNYKLDITGEGLKLSGVTNPVTVSLQMGDNQGIASINARILGRSGNRMRCGVRASLISRARALGNQGTGATDCPEGLRDHKSWGRGFRIP